MPLNELHLIARLGGQRIALSARTIDSVIEIDGLTPVPLAPPHISGLYALRSRVLTVIDGLAALDLGRTSVESSSPAVVVTVEGHLYGLLVDRVDEVVELEGEVARPRGALSPAWTRVVRGVVDHRGKPVLLVEEAALVAGPSSLPH
jgi:purine-binding chemotaxis protein CheW